MHGAGIIFMVWEAGGRGRLAQNYKKCIGLSMVLEVGGRGGGAAGFRNIIN